MANLLELLQESAKQYGSITALSEIKNNKYIDITFKELYENVTKAAIKIKVWESVKDQIFLYVGEIQLIGLYHFLEL